MKRAGFTMIELIFVIVILGILASVAVPKLIGVKASAEEGLAKGFVGTLNRTVGASKWSDSLMNDDNGSMAGNAIYNIGVADTEFPTGISSPLLSSTCTTSTTVIPSPMNSGASDAYRIYCLDGNDSSSPKFFYAKDDDAPNSATWTTAVANGELKIKKP